MDDYDDQPDAMSNQRAPMDQRLDQRRAHLRVTYGSLYDRLIQILLSLSRFLSGMMRL
jgi:hypothetical protein